MSRFYLSFTNGICRLSHGRTEEDAIIDAIRATAATLVACSLLDERLHKLGGTSWRGPGDCVYIPEANRT